MALNITEPDSRGLDFGTVLTSNVGGVTGRYAIDVTASDDGSGHLVLTNDSYGSSGSFTLTSTGLGLTDETVTGVDVAGTIGGEAATGSGQVLTGTSDNAHHRRSGGKIYGVPPLALMPARSVSLGRRRRSLLARTLRHHRLLRGVCCGQAEFPSGQNRRLHG